MKKMRSISIAVILVLCISVLCTGVYSASLVAVTITGDLSIIPATKPADVSINIQNANNLNVSFECDVVNAKDASATTITNSGVWTLQLAFSEDAFCNYLRLQAIKLEVLVTNNDSVPISVDISPVSNITQNSIDVTTIGNAYIAPGDTEEVSIQFSAVYDRGENDSVFEVVAPSITSCEYNAVVSQVDTSASVLSRVKYDATGIANGTMHYYIEFGDNPYYNATDAGAQGSSYAHRAKLRWYIWGKDKGTGAPTALVAGTDYNATTNTFISTGSTYYFISEYILDVDDNNMGISFQNEYTIESPKSNIYGNYPSDYSDSNMRNYLNGVTVKRTYISESKNCFANGSNINFLDRFNLTRDDLYSKIDARSLKNLYDNGASGTINELPASHADDVDKYWLLSLNDRLLIRSAKDINAVAYLLSGGNVNTAGYWWLRSPGGTLSTDCEQVVGINGVAIPICNVNRDDIGVRPAFQIII